MHYRMIRDRIIDFSEWPSRQLPIPFVDGDSCYIEGRQYTKSFVHEARDSQKLINYSMSEIASELKNRRREQWLATPDNITGNEQQWRNPETQQGALIAKPDPKTGMMPQKMPAWEVSQGLFMTSQMATQNVREILGFSENEALQGRDIRGRLVVQLVELDDHHHHRRRKQLSRGRVPRQGQHNRLVGLCSPAILSSTMGAYL